MYKNNNTIDITIPGIVTIYNMYDAFHFNKNKI